MALLDYVARQQTGPNSHSTLVRNELKHVDLEDPASEHRDVEGDNVPPFIFVCFKVEVAHYCQPEQLAGATFTHADFLPSAPKCLVKGWHVGSPTAFSSN